MRQQNDKQKNRKDNICKCPNCTENMYIFDISIGCEKCGDSFNVDFDVANNILDLDQETTLKINTIIMESYKKRKLLDKALLNRNEDDISIFTVSYKDNVLAVLKDIKKQYKFDSIMLVIKFITEGFLHIIGEMKKLDGNKIYLIDSNGNKSKELKKTILGKAYRAYNDELNKSIVEKYIESIKVQFKIENIKNGGENTGKE